MLPLHKQARWELSGCPGSDDCSLAASALHGVQHPSHSALLCPQDPVNPPLLPCHPRITQFLLPFQLEAKSSRKARTSQPVKHTTSDSLDFLAVQAV